MSDPSNALSDALEAALRQSEAVKTSMGGKVRLYTMSAPIAAPFPHVVLGDDQVIGDETECLASSEVYTTIHVWSQVEDDVGASRREARNIAAAIRHVMRIPLAIVGFYTTVQDFEETRHMVDRDGLTAHSVVTFRLLLDPRSA